MSMDKAIERKTFTAGRIAAIVVAVVLVAALVYAVTTNSSATHLSVDPTRMTTAKVDHGEFREYYPFDGRVEPATTVYLDVEEGGKVEEIFVAGGHAIEKGTPILRFSNTTLQRSSIETETRLLENLDQLRNTQFNRAQSNLQLKDTLLDLDHRLDELRKKHTRNTALIEESNAISREAFETSRDELVYLEEKRALLIQRIAQEEELSAKQVAQANDSIERLERSLELLREIVESLEVRAPISGFLSSIDVEIGQNVRGERIGQIDQLESFKIRVSIDQYYISRVEVGTPGKLELDGVSHAVTVKRIYPEVVNDAFSVDVEFVGPPPSTLRRGQRLTVELSFSESTQSLVVAKGGFYQTGAKYVYLIAPDRRSARRVPIRVARQNPRLVEVVEGLKPGDWIVSSGYDTFGEVDELRFTEPIELLD